MDIFLQFWGGTCYLLAKIFLAHAEGVNKNEKWRMYGWVVYLVGVPAWVIILVLKRNWIAAAIEAGGSPALILGIVVATRGLEQSPWWLKKSAEAFACGFLIVGVVYSMCDFGGITTISQVLEMGVMAGFLLGSYLLAKRNPIGWLWFMLMNGSMATLMAIQTKPILVVQQVVSLCFVIYGYLRARKNKGGTK